MVIYKIVNIINDKIYIGQTTQKLYRRINRHFSGKENSLISKSIKKYGKENFTIEEIETCETIDQLNEREIYWIKFYNSLSPNGYNLTTGGLNGLYSEESKKRCSLSHIGKIPAIKGKKMSIDSRLKISEAGKGREVKQETRDKLSQVHKGRKKSKEHCENISKSKKGFVMSEEQKKKLSEINKKRRVICPHCNKEGTFFGLNRWHFDNCKYKK